MATRHEVEVTVSSARDLKNVNWRHGDLRPYAVVWVDADRKFSTNVDQHGDTNPRWDYKLLVPVGQRINDDTILYIDIVQNEAREDTKPLIGSARLTLIDVLNEVVAGESVSRLLQLRRPSGRPQGKLEIKLRIIEHCPQVEPTLYSSAYGVAPPPSGGYFYGAGYGATPAQYGGQSSYWQPAHRQPSYGQPAHGQPSYGQLGYGQQSGGQLEGQKKSGSGYGGMAAGLAVGAVAGALGAVAISEGIDRLEDKIADDVADKLEDDDYGW